MTAAGAQTAWERDDLEMTANRGRNPGREARQHQDRDAEDGGA